MYFFLALYKDGNVGFSPVPEMDKLRPWVGYLRVPLPLGTIQVIQNQMKRELGRAFLRSGNGDKNDDILKSKLVKVLNSQDWSIPKVTIEEIVVTPDNQKSQFSDTTDPSFQMFDQIVLGRQLSLSDLKILARELKRNLETIIEFAQVNVRREKAEWVPAVLPLGKDWQCQRCGERGVTEWPSYYGRAATCPVCNNLGSNTSLEVLYRDGRSLLKGPDEVCFHPHWTLTEAQGRASEQVLDFMQGSESKALLWAACGSGKTEVCFPAAARALEQGQSVLFAAPRQDVINDVAPRLKRDFPGFPIQVLTGASPIKFQTGRMVLATTHQVLRFWRAFDVIFLDEMDAFPYRGSNALEWGVRHALKSAGKLLFLTATPSPEGLKEVRQRKMRLIQLPARHHRTALPAPNIERVSYTLDPAGNPLISRDKYEALHNKGPILVFVPKISWIYPWVNRFRRTFPEWEIDGSFSSDPERFLKCEKLRLNKFDIFVSTTILERGITLARIQVVVLAADHPLFDERALVQMAGRVGRTRESPEGSVIFMSQAETIAMKTAIHWIKGQNRLALAQGLIDNVSRGEAND
jgi:competence protein ComFA